MRVDRRRVSQWRSQICFQAVQCDSFQTLSLGHRRIPQPMWQYSRYSLLGMVQHGELDRPGSSGRGGSTGRRVNRRECLQRVGSSAVVVRQTGRIDVLGLEGTAVWSTGGGSSIARPRPQKIQTPDKLSSRRSDKRCRVGTYLSQISCRALPSWVASESLSGAVGSRVWHPCRNEALRCARYGVRRSDFQPPTVRIWPVPASRNCTPGLIHTCRIWIHCVHRGTQSC